MQNFLASVSWPTVIVAVVLALVIDGFILDRM